MKSPVLIIILTIFSMFLFGCNKNNETLKQDDAIISSNPKIFESVYVDVREKSEWNEWHIEGALHLRLSDIQSWNTASLPRNKNIILYCRSGHRSAIALQSLKKQGFTNASDVGGMTEVRGVKIIKL